MRVLFAQSAATGPLFHRVTEPIRAIREAGADVELVTRRGLATTMSRPVDGAEPEVVDVDDEGADVVVFQLPTTLAMLQCIRMFKSRGIAVVVEMDDLLSAVPYGHVSHGGLVLSGKARMARECAHEADVVTTTTPALLAEYATHGRGIVVPNAIPRRIAELPPAYERTPDVVSIGWTGTVARHPYDLQEMGSGMQQALDRTAGRSRFTILGERYDAKERLHLSDQPGEVPWLMDPEVYLTQIGELFDIGVAPLRLDKFNASKSWLKPLEYSARGVFCVRARTEEYERLGLGMPARSPKDWAKWITTGVLDHDRRAELAAAAREKVLAGHLTEHTAEHWIGAWRAALEHAARTRGSLAASHR